jgi:hypothetical protein
MLKKTSVIIISVVLVFIVAVGLVFWFAVKPLYTGDFFENTFEELFPDNPELLENISFWEENGYEQSISLDLTNKITGLETTLSLLLERVSYGKDSHKGSNAITIEIPDQKITFEVFYDQQRISVCGLSDVPLTISRENIRAELEKSMFAPNSDSGFALTEASFEELVSTMEGIVSPEKSDEAGSEEDKELEKAFDSILAKAKKQIKINSSLQLFKNGFLSRKDELSLNKSAILAFFDIIIDEAQTNEVFENFLKNVYYTPQNYKPQDGGAVPLSFNPNEADAITKTFYGTDAIEALKADFEKECEIFKIKLSYVTGGRYLDSAELLFKTKFKDEEAYELKFKTDFEFSDEKTDVKLKISEKTDSEEYLIIKLSKENDLDGIFAKLDYESAKIIKGETKNQKKLKATLSYNLEEERYTVNVERPGLNSDWKIDGTYAIDAEEHSLLFSVDKIYKDDELYYRRTLLRIAVNKTSNTAQDFSAPTGTAVLTLNALQLRRTFVNFPFYKCEKMFYNLTGNTFGFYYTKDNTLLLGGNAAIEAINECIEKYNNREPEKDRYNHYINATYIYLEEYDIYVVFSYYSSGYYVANVYQYLPETTRNFHSARYDKNGNFVIHDLEFVSGTTYVCRECGKEVTK